MRSWTGSNCTSGLATWSKPSESATSMIAVPVVRHGPVGVSATAMRMIFPVCCAK